METVIIIGGGASGLACASELSKTNKYRIIILDQANKLARKVLASGNGRCNISNSDLDMKNYNTTDRRIEKIINEFDVKDFFNERGMLTRNMDNLVYPYSLSSLTVKTVLLDSLKNVEIVPECQVLKVKKVDSYVVITSRGSYSGDYVVIASGSKASKLSGEKNLDMLNELSIKVKPFLPSLVQLNCTPVYKGLKGVRVKCKATLYQDDNYVDSKVGEVLFNDTGLSGICIMQLSRYYYNFGDNQEISLDIMPEYSDEEIKTIIKDNNYYQGIFNEKLANVIMNNNLDVKNIRFTVKSTKDYTNAQVMHGGVSLKEINDKLELNKYPGMFVIGEALDVDGDCGGYNLHFAFASGYHVARYLIEKEN